MRNTCYALQLTSSSEGQTIAPGKMIVSYVCGLFLLLMLTIAKSNGKGKCWYSFSEFAYLVARIKYIQHSLICFRRQNNGNLGKK